MSVDENKANNERIIEQEIQSWNNIPLKRPGLLTNKNGQTCSECTTWAPLLRHCIPLQNATAKQIAVYTEWYLSSDTTDFNPNLTTKKEPP
jgi:hypothetical protein